MNTQVVIALMSIIFTLTGLFFSLSCLLWLVVLATKHSSIKKVAVLTLKTSGYLALSYVGIMVLQIVVTFIRELLA